jgi:hypothetical protein
MNVCVCDESYLKIMLTYSIPFIILSEEIPVWTLNVANVSFFVLTFLVYLLVFLVSLIIHKFLTWSLLNSDLYSLHINCGGNQATVNKTSYVGDSDSSRPARFDVSSTGNWAFSSTGQFVDSDLLGKTFSPQSISKLTMVDSELYTNARVSPISLTYYGFCLANGSYTVNLHFAEIMFTNDQTYSSLGRRVFDIYLQVHGLTNFFQ